MVGIKRLYILLILCTLPHFTNAQNGGFIQRQLSQLSLRGEKTAEMLSAAREQYSLTPCDSLSMVIHELEKQSLAIEGAIARLLERQAQVVVEAAEEVEVAKPEPEPQPEEVEPKAEVEEIVSEQPAATTPQEQTELPAEPEPVLAPIPAKEQPDNKPLVSEELKTLFNTTSRRYALIEGEIMGLIGEYGKAYNDILASLKGYEKATSLTTLEKHHKEYLAAVERSKSLADNIADRSDLLFTSKTNSLLMFADSLGMDSLRVDYTALSEQTESAISEKLMGKCTDLDLAMYPHRLLGTFRLEAQLAKHLAPEAADSLLSRTEEFDTTFTLFSPYGTPKRSNAKFTAVSISKKAKERAVSSLPLIKIPSEGELYSIMVGNYASLPPSTKVFRGAEPLYRERREDGRTYIYLGLYPTAQSAQDDIALLRKVGFKQPTLVMWRDGIRRDDYVNKNSGSTAAKKPAMYRIEIGGATTALPSEVLNVIREKAPRKEISKYTSSEGAVVYTLGIFTSEKEAQTLATAIAKASPDLTTSVTQVGKK